MEITVEKLQELGACQPAIDAFPERWGKSVDVLELLKSLRYRANLYWADWLLVRVMGRYQYLAYIIFVAEQSLDIFEKHFPKDNRPRMAIEAAKTVLNIDTEETRGAARLVSESSWIAWEATKVVVRAWESVVVAREAAIVAREAALPTARENRTDWTLSTAAGEKMELKILDYGIQLLERGESKWVKI